MIDLNGNRTSGALMLKNLRLMLLLCLMSLGFGCASKVVVQEPVVPPPPSRPSVQDALMAQYERWKGVPYRSGGEDGNGFDCSGLMRVVFRDAFNMDLPRTSAEQSRLGEPANRDALQPGDLLYFLDKGTDHIGVSVVERRFLHSSLSKGVIISDLDGYWAPRLLRVRRIPGLAEATSDASLIAPPPLSPVATRTPPKRPAGTR